MKSRTSFAPAPSLDVAVGQGAPAASGNKKRPWCLSEEMMGGSEERPENRLLPPAVGRLGGSDSLPALEGGVPSGLHWGCMRVAF